MRTTAPMTRRDRWIDGVLWTAAALSACAMVVFSMFTTPPTGEGLLSDDVLHAGSYLIMTLCLLLAGVWRPGRGDGRWPSGTLAVAVGLFLVGVVFELAQGAFTTRGTQVSDLVADAVGIAGALGVHGLLRARSTSTRA